MANPDDPRLPEFDGLPAAGALLEGPIEVVPLYSVLGAIHMEMSGKAANACLPVCYQVVGALRHLGFDAEVIAAYVEVYQGHHRFTDIGVDKPPTVRADWTTDGHAIVWAGSFGRLVDPTVAQHPELNRAAHQDIAFSAPIVLPVGNRDTLLEGAVGAIRPPYQLAYLVQPQYTGRFDGWFTEFAEALDYGALSIAHRALIFLEVTGRMRNLRQLSSLYPQLGALLAGTGRLPELPASPPAAVTQLAATFRTGE
uniref:hypothetical protein n=1 Tax=Actinoplanes sp. CA-151224 TaxID=3239904 RepID=UPI003F49A155